MQQYMQQEEGGEQTSRWQRLVDRLRAVVLTAQLSYEPRHAEVWGHMCPIITIISNEFCIHMPSSSL
jgi:hypothetical protein